VRRHHRRADGLARFLRGGELRLADSQVTASRNSLRSACEEASSSARSSFSLGAASLFFFPYREKHLVSAGGNDTCKGLLEQFANTSSSFVYCAVKHARPIRICQACVTELEDVASDTEATRSIIQPVVRESQHPYPDECNASGTVRLPGWFFI